MAFEPALCGDAQRLVVVLARRWSVPILHALHGGRLRHRDLHRAVGGVADKVLVETLKELEREGLIERLVYPEVPIRVEYGLTDAGAGLWASFAVLNEWAERFRPARTTVPTECA